MGIRNIDFDVPTHTYARILIETHQRSLIIIILLTTLEFYARVRYYYYNEFNHARRVIYI